MSYPQRQSRGIEHFFKERLSKPAKPGEQLEPNIYNLDSYFSTTQNPLFNEAYYLKCKYFIDSVSKQIGNELDENKGNIIELYPNPNYQTSPEYPEMLKKMFEIKDLYAKLYLEGLNPANHQRTEDGQIYPDYYKDLYSKGYKPYELLEKSLGLSNEISKQSDSEFLETLEKRVAGLVDCQKNPIGQKPGADIYFEKEYARESAARDLVDKTTAELIEEKCKAIYYSSDMLKASEKIQSDTIFQNEVIAKYQEFFKDPKEVAYARTFLPNECFLADGNIDIGKVKDLIISNNRDFRQFVFGFFNTPELKKFIELKPFLFEVGGMESSIERKVSCHPLVNWTLLLNLLYCKCAIANSKVDFPVRFILPDKNYTKVDTDYLDANGNLVKKIVLRDKTGLIDLFNVRKTELSAELIGILTIKYYIFNYEKKRWEIRCWFLYLFKNNEFGNETRRDLINGLHNTILLVNSMLQLVNLGSIAERHNITHTELTFFYNMIYKKGNDKLYVYASRLLNSVGLHKLDEFTLLFSKKPNLEKDIYYKENLGLIKVNLENLQSTDKQHLFPSKIFKITFINNIINKTSNKLSGGSLVMDTILKNIKIQTSQNLDVYYGDDNICGFFYNKYQEYALKLKRLLNDKHGYEKIYNAFDCYFEYLLITPNNARFSHLEHDTKYSESVITSYKPLSNNFFVLNELIKKFNLSKFINKNSKIQSIGSNLGFAEVIKFNNYKVNNIEIIITNNINYYKLVQDKWKNIIKNISSIYNLKLTNYNDSIYNIIDYNKKNTEKENYKKDIVFYGVFDIIKPLQLYESFYNFPILYMGLLYALECLNKNGIFIIHLGSVAYKCTADIYLLLSNFFEESHLFYSELSNHYKKTGTYGIFINFKNNLLQDTHDELYQNLEKIKNIFPNGVHDFNVTDNNLLKKYILTPINDIQIKNIIIGLLNINISKSEYSSIMNFNNQRYIKQLIFCEKVLKLLESDASLDTKLPTNDQIINAVIYCQKWGIPYWDKYTNKPFQDKFGKLVLEETFGIHQPIIYHFKTPTQLRTAKSITLCLPSGRRLTSKSSSVNLSSSRTKKSSHSQRISISAFLKPSSHKLHDISFKSLKESPSRNKSISYNRQVPLLPELEYFANRINQTGYLIDSRRDFSQTDPGKQNAKWWEINKQFRYYKHKDDTEKMHLDQLVRRRLKDDTISQAWLKMYEIITDCELLPTHRKGAFRSFHIAEAPGTFINALNNYIHTKTQFSRFDWNAQSLHAKGTRIGDQFGLIKRHPTRWDWGVTGDGDITKIRNIKYYKQLVASREKIDLMTSDAGLAMKESGYEKVAFATLLAILDILPVDASMVYKILTPIDEPLILNLIYVAYCNFRQLIFYKPVQNNQSREFYIIGKGYLGTDANILEAFYDELKNFKEGSNRDLFQDKYPEAFVRQFVAISRQLADNYCYTIERNIYYLDNYENITPEFAQMARDYYDEKNQDWLDKYKPKRIENEVDKL